MIEKDHLFQPAQTSCTKKTWHPDCKLLRSTRITRAFRSYIPWRSAIAEEPAECRTCCLRHLDLRHPQTYKAGNIRQSVIMQINVHRNEVLVAARSGYTHTLSWAPFWPPSLCPVQLVEQARHNWPRTNCARENATRLKPRTMASMSSINASYLISTPRVHGVDELSTLKTPGIPVRQFIRKDLPDLP